MNKTKHGYLPRIIAPGLVYHIVIKTADRFPFFMEEIFCELFLATLFLAKKYFKFELYCFCLLHEHAHLLMKFDDANNSSKVFHFIKMNVSKNANRILKYNLLRKYNHVEEDDHPPPHVENYFSALSSESKNFIMSQDVLVERLKFDFHSKYSKPELHFPKFSWQKSFFDHYLRNQKSFEKTLSYIQTNPRKHKLTDDWESYRWSSMNSEYRKYIDTVSPWQWH